VIYATFIVTTLVRERGFSESLAGNFWMWVGILSAALHNYGDVFVFDTAPRASMRRSGKARD